MAQELVKVFTRDFSLFITQWWRQVQTDNFVRMLGVGYTDSPAAHDGFSVAYFYLQQDWDAIGLAVIEKLRKNPDFYAQVRVPYLDNVRQAHSFLQTVANQDVLTPETVNRFRVLFYGLYPVLRFSNAIPSNWADSMRHLLGQKAEDIIQMALEDRARTEGVFEAIDSQLRRLATGSLTREGKPGKLAKFLTADELNALARGEAVDWTDVSSRTAGFTYCRGRLYATKDYASIFRENGYAYDEPKVAGSEVVGSIAHDGGVRHGVVRRVFALEQLDAFQAGEVLVCPMTVPDYVPVMKKAVAVVTDEGGMGCHAAIVCRELRIPCIVGTKVATRLFSDGDHVEVNTTAGRVRKLA